MVKAADNFIYGKDFYKEGDEIPASLLPELEKHQCSHLSTFVSVNGTYHKITNPRVKGWIMQRKNLERRLINYFKDIPEKDLGYWDEKKKEPEKTSPKKVKK